jgi:hypothetical protein
MRDYDPTTGRYLQGDPLGLVDGASVYGYALQSPERYTDPRGEQSISKPGFPLPLPGTELGDGLAETLPDLLELFNPLPLMKYCIDGVCTALGVCPSDDDSEQQRCRKVYKETAAFGCAKGRSFDSFAYGKAVEQACAAGAGQAFGTASA